MKKSIVFVFILIIIVTGILISQPYRWKRLIDADAFDIAANPKNYNTLYAGGIGRVIYRSWDAGRTWDTFEIIYRGGAAILNNVIVHPIDTNVVIVGGLLFGEIQRSTDMGETWKSALTRKRPVALNGKAMMYDPNNPDIMYLGDFMTGDVFKSMNRGASWDSISSIKKWITILDTLGNPMDTLIPMTIASMGMREDSTNILFANGTGGEVFMSNDSGKTWKFIQYLVKPELEQGDCEITRMVFSPRDPLTGYAVITYLFFSNLPNGGLYKTTDGGYNWFLQAFKDTSMWAVAVREFNGDDEVFIGGYTEDFYVIESERVPGTGIVRRSQDGGNKWYSYDANISWWNKNFRSDSDIYFVHFLNSRLGFIGGEDGVLWRTVDSGNTWRNFSYELYDDIYTAHFYSLSTGFIAGKNGFIKKTTNSGMIWRNSNSNTDNSIYSLTFIDSAKGIAVGEKGTIILSTNEGADWFNVSSGTNRNLRSLKIINSNTAIAVGDEGTILKTTDLGDTWFAISSPSSADLKKVFFVDENLGFITGDMGTFLKTTDSGNQWQILDANTNLSLNSVYFIDSNIGLICGNKGLLLKTTDGGQTFIETYKEMNYDLNDIAFANDSTATLVGDFKMAYHTTDLGNSWVIRLYGYGATANMWSLRFLGPENQEKLYMASEAGLFVLDDPSPVIEYRNNPQSTLFVSRTNSDDVIVKYNRNEPDRFLPLKFRIIDILGRIIIERNINNSKSYIEFVLHLPEITSAVYLCQMIEGEQINTLKVIFE